MERESSPEYIYIDCGNCGSSIQLNDETCGIQAYIDPEYVKYSFVMVACPNDTCEPICLFVTPEQIAKLNYLSNHFIESRPNDQALAYLAEQYSLIYGDTEETETAKEWGEVMLRFLLVYQPEAWEFE